MILTPVLYLGRWLRKYRRRYQHPPYGRNAVNTVKRSVSCNGQCLPELEAATHSTPSDSRHQSLPAAPRPLTLFLRPSISKKEMVPLR